MIWVFVAWVVLALLISSGVAAWQHLDFRGWYLMFLFYLVAIPVVLVTLGLLLNGILS